eukprot:1127158-Rhodomonas_salina.2
MAVSTALPSVPSLICALSLSLLLSVNSQPASPSGFSVDFVTASEIALKWDITPGAEHHKVDFREANSGALFESFGPGAVFTVPYLVVGSLHKNTEYDFQVFSGNELGWSPPQVLGHSAAPVDPPFDPILVEEDRWFSISDLISDAIPRRAFGLIEM